MTTASVPDDEQPPRGAAPGRPGALDAHQQPPSTVPSAGMVLHRVLARAARTFLLNDMAGELLDSDDRCESVDASSIHPPGRPLWAHTVAIRTSEQPRTTEAERIHQSRVALRRIRSNLRTFRLAVDPAWGTSLRAELAWYGRHLGRARDLDVLRSVVADAATEVLRPGEAERLLAVVAERQASVAADIAAGRGSARRFQLTEQMMVLWDGPDFEPKASRPAPDVLLPALGRAWHDLRGAARVARKDPSDDHLHTVRIRLKDLRYGCETVALVEGGPARKVAAAAERLQTKLGDVHDAVSSVAWLEELAAERPYLTGPAERLITAQRAEAASSRKGWKRELNEVERRWRRWMR